ncbi:dethiobiotin synthase [Aurantibacillus circumpalustris]|uniref:dethiobiotin synthase n=1 Tax=Aurantibacillus circumpalustris TaxID=3036359 RepID=UPI00295B1863|nr:dethiobiotin synthase [Aurantibacillus circumpalustris]
MRTIVIAGIGTEVGKTVVSAVLVEALQADYWKPIQAGDLEHSDTLKVQKLVSSKQSFFHSEKYRLNTPMSPHAAAEIDSTEINLKALNIPETKNNLIIELAGGLMVPLNSEKLNLDLLKSWMVPVILVSKNYLGSINHTLLSLEVLKTNKVPVLGIIFNGIENKSTEEFILNYSNMHCIGRIEELPELNKKIIKVQAEKIKSELQKLL